MSKSYKLCIASGSEDFVLAYLPNFDPVPHLDHLSHVYLFGATLVMYPGDPCLEREVANLLFYLWEVGGHTKLDSLQQHMEFFYLWFLVFWSNYM